MNEPDLLARIESLLAELRPLLAEAPAALSAQAMVAFNAGDKAGLDALMERRGRYAELAASLGEAIVAAPGVAPVAQVPVTPMVSVPAPVVAQVAAPVIAPPSPVIPKPNGRPVALPPLPKLPAPKIVTVRTAPVSKPKVEKPKPEGPLEGRALAATRARYFAEARTVLAQPGNGPVRMARIKALVCLGRALEGALDGDEQRLAREELTSLKAAWNEAGGHGFFALNPGKWAAAEDWHRLARAYALVAEAEEARPVLRENREGATDAVATFAAIVGFAHATLGAVFPGTPDVEITSLRETLTELGGALRALDVQKALEARPGEWARYEEIATGLPAQVTKLRADSAKRGRQEDALGGFERLFREGEADAEFVDRLVATARDAVMAGVRPNNPRLRDPMMPFREAMQELDDPALRPLIEELKKQERAILTKQRKEIELDAHQGDPEHEERLAAVRAFLADKSLGFAGSRKGNDKRVEEFRRQLGAKELVWPDVEKHHAVGRLVDSVGRCDVVCLLVRFCRHSYKDALDEAKELGGRMVFLPRGLGLHTVVFELYTQLRLNDPVPVA